MRHVEVSIIPFMKESFVAVVGVENGDHCREIAYSLDWQLGRAAVGMLMSEKTGLDNTPNRHGPIYPTFERAEQITRTASHLDLPVIVHYNTDRPEEVGMQLVRALDRHEHVAAVQVNGLRPHNFDRLSRLRQERPEITTIMQIDGELLESYRCRPEKLGEILSQYGDIIDGVWLDGSGGWGKLLDARRLLPFIETINMHGIGIGVAGGLSSRNVEDALSGLLKRYRNDELFHPLSISWDAQSGVMDSTDQVRRFNTRKAVDFLCSSLRAQQTIKRSDTMGSC